MVILLEAENKSQFVASRKWELESSSRRELDSANFNEQGNSDPRKELIPTNLDL